LYTDTPEVLPGFGPKYTSQRLGEDFGFATIDQQCVIPAFVWISSNTGNEKENC
jgi:hypothetical protein